MAPSRVKRMKKWRRGSGRNEEEAQLHIWEFQFPDSIVIEFLCLWFLHPTRIAQGLFTPNVWIPKTIDGWLRGCLDEGCFEWYDPKLITHHPKLVGPTKKILFGHHHLVLVILFWWFYHSKNWVMKRESENTFSLFSKLITHDSVAVP